MRKPQFVAWIATSALFTLTLGTLGTSVAIAQPAPDKATCIAAAERGQKERNDGKLPDAQKSFLLCSRYECPAYVRSDCAQFLSEVNAVMPSIVVAARMNGKDLFEVRVMVDGATVSERLDGRGIPMGVGEHSLRFEYGSEPAVETKVLMREGDKNRAIDVQFAGNGQPASATSPTPGILPIPPPPPPPPPPPARENTIFPWVVAGVGLASLGTGIALFIVGNNRIPSECSKSDATCFLPGSTKAQQDDVTDKASSAHGMSNVGLGLMIGGGVALAGGIVWHFLEPTDPKVAPKSARGLLVPGARVQVLPSIGAREQGFVLTSPF